MGSVLEVNIENWEEQILRSNILTVVEFWHIQCPWCISFESIINEVSEEYAGKIKFTKLNVLENPKNRELAISYGIMSTPTLVFFCSGRPIEEVVGFMPKEHLKKTLDDVLGKHKECFVQSTELKI